MPKVPLGMPTSIGARLRYTLNRDSEAYKLTYNQRTAVERGTSLWGINSQAVALGKVALRGAIERPHLRKSGPSRGHGNAITNQNTLIYSS